MPLTFTIPSLHQNIKLHCRVYHPAEEQMCGLEKRGAIIAHPWARLGGSYDDPAILAAVNALLDSGYVVGTFNFRGAKPSGGSCSWSGDAEVEDYISFVGFFMQYMKRLEWRYLTPSRQRRNSAPPTRSCSPKNGSNENDDDDDERDRETEAPQSSSGWRSVFRRRKSFSLSAKPDDGLPPMKYQKRRAGPVSIILGGYSYGSVILFNLPSINRIIGRFAIHSPESIEWKIVKVASLMSSHMNGRTHAEELEQVQANRQAVLAPRPHPKTYRAKHGVKSLKRSKSQPSMSPASRGGDMAFVGSYVSQHSNISDPITVRYLFISPVRPFYSWLLKRHHGRRDTADLSMHDVLVVYGDGDQLGGKHAAKNLVQGPHVKVKCVENGHLWVETHVQKRLMAIIKNWASRADDSTS